MHINIRSITDVITNSSSTAYCFKIDEDYADLVQFMKDAGAWYPDTFTEIRTLDDVKKIVFSGEYRDWDEWAWPYPSEAPHNAVYPVEDYFGGNKNEVIKLLAGGLTRDEIWEKLKHDYDPVVGYAFGDFDHDGVVSDEMNAIEAYFGKKSHERVLKFFKGLTAGKIYTAHIKNNSSLTELYPEDFYLLYSGDPESFSAVYNPGFIEEEKFVLKDDGYILYSLDLKTIRESTPKEVEIFMKALENKGWEIKDGTLICM